MSRSPLNTLLEDCHFGFIQELGRRHLRRRERRGREAVDRGREGRRGARPRGHLPPHRLGPRGKGAQGEERHRPKGADESAHQSDGGKGCRSVNL